MWALSICIALAALSGGVLLLTLPGALKSPTYHEVQYGLMIDAGSSGSRIFLYTWNYRKTAEWPVVRALLDPNTNTSLVQKVLPGLQSYQVRESPRTSVFCLIQAHASGCDAPVSHTTRHFI